MTESNKIFLLENFLHFIVVIEIEQLCIFAMSLLLKSFTLFAIVNSVQMQQFFGEKKVNFKLIVQRVREFI